MYKYEVGLRTTLSEEAIDFTITEFKVFLEFQEILNFLPL